MNIEKTNMKTETDNIIPAVELENVSKSFGKTQVLKNVHFLVPSNCIFGLIGPSGSGKTTLLRTLIGFYKPDNGSISIFGKQVENIPSELFGFGTQDNSFYDELTCWENLVYFGRMYGMSAELIEYHAEQNLNLVGLYRERHREAAKLSGGMQRRLDLAIAMMHSPKVLILDEPAAGLDPKLRKQIWQLVKETKKEGMTVIVSSHLLRDMEHLCDEIAIINEGSVLEVGTPKALKERYSKCEELRVETHEGNYDMLYDEIVRRGVNVQYARPEDHIMVLYVEDVEHAIRGVLDSINALGHHLEELDVNKPSLSEVFETLMEKEQDKK